MPNSNTYNNLQRSLKMQFHEFLSWFSILKVKTISFNELGTNLIMEDSKEQLGDIISQRLSFVQLVTISV